MVSEVFVELVGDNGVSPTKVAAFLELSEGFIFCDGTAGVGEESIFGVEIECGHVFVPVRFSHKPI